MQSYYSPLCTLSPPASGTLLMPKAPIKNVWYGTVRVHAAKERQEMKLQDGIEWGRGCAILYGT